MTIDPFATAGTLVAALRTGQLGSLELLDAYLARIEENAGGINALAIIDAERARKLAKEADNALARGDEPGQLHGLPVTVKELFDVKGLPTSWGDPGWQNNIARQNSAVVERLEDAGVVVFGKTNIPRFMADWETHNPLHGGTRNPWNMDHSSGGSAAAVAAGLTGADIGHEWGGSLRQPAHYCGVFHLHSSHGIIPNAGTTPWGDRRQGEFAVAGPLARSAGDLSLLLSVLAGPGSADADGWQLALPPARHEKLRDFRVAAMFEHPACEIDTRYADDLHDLADRLAGCGVEVDTVARPAIDFDRVFDLFTLLVRAATSAFRGDEEFEALQGALAAGDLPAGFHAERNALATTATHRAWLAAHEERLSMREAWRDFFKDHDILLCPAGATAAPLFDDSGNVAGRTIPVNGRDVLIEYQRFWYSHASLGGLPAVIAPIGWIDDLPVGVQIIGPRFGDYTAIRFAELLDEVGVGFEALAA